MENNAQFHFIDNKIRLEYFTRNSVADLTTRNVKYDLET